MFEQLETRRMFAVTASLNTKTLMVIGDNQQNTITINFKAQNIGDGLDIEVRSGAGVIGTFDEDDVELIHVDLKGGDDILTKFGAGDRGDDEDTTVFAGGGNDIVAFHDGPEVRKARPRDTVVATVMSGECDPSDDRIFGEGGNDAILAGGGDDFVSGGAGNDNIDGGRDDDMIFGDGGNDVLMGGHGDDFLAGGAGIFDQAIDGQGSNSSGGGNEIEFLS